MDEIFLFILKCFYLMLPAYFANMAPVIVRKINFLAYPIDFNKQIAGKPILGHNKTFRGIFFGVAFAVAIAYVQHLMYAKEAFRGISFIDYGNWMFLGVLMGLGALTGDLIKSVFKRRLGINPGERFVPFDQTDFAIGALALAMLFLNVTAKIFIVAVALSFVLHVATNHLAFYLRIRNEKW